MLELKYKSRDTKVMLLIIITFGTVSHCQNGIVSLFWATRTAAVSKDGITFFAIF